MSAPGLPSRPPPAPAGPVKIAHLTTTDISLRFLLLEQLRAVRDAGGEAIGISAPGPFVEDLAREGIRHVPLPSSTRGMDPLADLRAMTELWTVLRRERPLVLHVHNPKTGIYGRVVGRLAGIPIVVNTQHGLYATDTDPWAKRLAVYSLEAIAARFSDAELVHNPEDLALLRRWRIAPSARLLGSGVDLVRFDPDRFPTETRRAVRGELGIAEDRVVVGCVGRLVAEKGYLELLDAWERLDPDRFSLVVVGGEDPAKPDALGHELLERARASGVHLLGQRDDVDALYPAMDIFVLASHREGVPRAAMEAAAMGLPIVATDIRGCREVVTHGRNGLLVPVRDPVALRAAVERIGSDPAQRAAMGRASRSMAAEHFDERSVVRRTLETYREVAAAKHVPFALGAP